MWWFGVDSCGTVYWQTVVKTVMHLRFAYEEGDFLMDVRCTTPPPPQKEYYLTFCNTMCTIACFEHTQTESFEAVLPSECLEWRYGICRAM